MKKKKKLVALPGQRERKNRLKIKCLVRDNFERKDNKLNVHEDYFKRGSKYLSGGKEITNFNFV